MEPKRVDIAAAAADTFAIATRHAPSIIAAVILFLLTLWVPYVNLGTLIALTLLPVRLARDERIEALSIFRSEYRRRMGDFLLTAALKQAALALGTALLVIPGVVLALAWKPAYWCLAEHDKSPLEAIRGLPGHRHQPRLVDRPLRLRRPRAVDPHVALRRRLETAARQRAVAPRPGSLALPRKPFFVAEIFFIEKR